MAWGGLARYHVKVNQALAAIRGVRWPFGFAWLYAWAVAERGRFVPWLPVFMGGGALGYFAMTAEPVWWSGLAAVVAGVALCRLCWMAWAPRAIALALTAAALGFASAQFATWRAPPIETFPRKAAVLTGVVRGVETLPEGRRVTVADGRVGDGPAMVRTIHVRLRDNDPAVLAAGDTIRIRIVLRPPAPPAYPGAWDLQRDAYFSGLGGSGAALGPVTLVAQATPAGPARWLQGLRDAIAGRIMAALPGTEGAIAATLLTGTASAIPPPDRAAFRDSGLAHLLAVAGLHIGIVMGLAMGGTRLALSLSEWAALHWPCKQIAAWTALAVGAGYLLLTGVHIPILRSFAMAAVVTLGIAAGRRAISLRGLAIAAVVILLMAPQEVVGVSFQMSFAAVLALIAGYEAMQPLLARLYERRMLHHLAALVLTSLLAGLASAPFGAYHFGQVQLYFVLANLVAVPLTAVWVMPAGLAALALMPLGLERLALTPMGWGIDLVLWVARFVSALPAATIAVPHMPGWGLAVIGLGLAWLGLWRTRWRLAGAVAIVAGLLSGAVSPAADLLVSSDARLIALNAPGGAYVQTRPGESRFVLDSWQQYWAMTLDTPFPESGAPGPVQCNVDGCRIHQGGVTVLLARSLHPMDCTGAALVVSAEPARVVCPALPRIDRFAVWRNGAQAVWLGQGTATVVSDRAFRGDRRWVPPSPVAQTAHDEPALPMAMAEPLPD